MNSQSRITIVGTSGSGKSTLARRLSRALHLTDIELDALHWEANWTPAPMPVFRERIEKAMAESPGWVVHGNYNKVADLTVGRAQMMIWLDYSKPLVLWRVIKRSISRILRGEELWAGNRESFRKTFLSRESIIKWSWDTYAIRKKRYTELINSPESAHLTILRFRTPREAETFFANHLPDWKT